jgi:hypothetical protein
VNLSEKHLRQYIKETILLESKNINEVGAHVAIAVAARRKQEEKRREEKRREEERRKAKAANKQKYRRRRSYPSKPPLSPEEQKKRKILKQRILDSRNFLSVNWQYSSHIKDEYPDHIKDWKEWLFKYIENERNTDPNINMIIKKDGNKYVIDEDLISKATNYDDDTDPLFSPEWVKKLEKRYTDVRSFALQREMQKQDSILKFDTYQPGEYYPGDIIENQEIV